MQQAGTKPKKKASWLQFPLLGLIILVLLGSIGMTLRNLRNARDWNEQVVALKQKWVDSGEINKDHLKLPSFLPYSLLPEDQPKKNSIPVEIPPGNDRLTKAMRIVREMHTDYANTTKGGAPAGLEYGWRDLHCELFQGAKSSFPDRLEAGLRAQQPNVDRLMELEGYLDLWQEIESCALQDGLIAHDWDEFRCYLMELSIIPLRPLIQSGQSRALAENIIGRLSLMDAITSKPDGRSRFWPEPYQIMAQFISATLRSQEFSYRRSDWNGLDWSPLMKYAQPLTRRELALCYEQWAAEREKLFFPANRAYLERAGDSIFKSILSGPVTKLRKSSFASFAESGRLADFMAIEEDTYFPLISGLIKFQAGPSMYFTSVYVGNNGMVWLDDLMLRLIRGDSYDAMLKDGKSPYLSHLFDFGMDVRIAQKEPGRYPGRYVVLFSDHKFDLEAPRSLDPFNGEVLAFPSVSFFNTSDTLHQVPLGETIVLNDLLKPRTDRHN